MNRYNNTNLRTRRLTETLMVLGLFLVAATAAGRPWVEWSWLPFFNGLGAGMFVAGAGCVALSRLGLGQAKIESWERPAPPAYDERDWQLRLQALSLAGMVLAVGTVIFLAMDLPPGTPSGPWVGGALLLGLLSYGGALVGLGRAGSDARG